jgi:hypothetical protein
MARFGPFELDPVRRQLARDGRELHLTPKAFDLLTLLVDAAPRVVPKKELHDALWPRGIVSDAALAGLVKEIRQALGGHDRDAPTIRTAHRIGYALASPRDDPRGVAPTASACWLAAGDRRFGLYPGENVVGRDAGSTVWLDDVTVSRRHARIVVGDTGSALEDLDSKNGTFVGGSRLERSTHLHDGDALQFGSVLVTYRTSPSAGPTVSAAHPPARGTPVRARV